MSQYQPTPPSSTPYTATAVPASERTNTLSIVALVLAFVVPLGGIICGHIALGQIKRTGEKGHGLALAGTVLGYIFVALGIIVAIAYFVFIAAVINSGVPNH